VNGVVPELYERRVLVTVPALGITLEYGAEVGAAHRFAEALPSALEVRIVIDDHVHPGLPPLPCWRLWKWA
jgi:hypothetical protein